MGADVIFDGDEQKRIDSGELVFLGIVCYAPRTNTALMFFNSVIPAEESAAILEKFMRAKVKFNPT